MKTVADEEHRLVCSATAIWVVLAACGPPPASFERLISSVPDDALLEPTAWLDRQPVDLGGLAGWHPRLPATEASRPVRRDDGALLIDTGETVVELWHGRADAGDTDAFLITLGSARAVEAQLCWTGAGDEAEELCIEPEAIDGLLTRRSYRFEVGGYRAWQGELRSLRLTARQAMAAPIHVFAIDAFRDSPSKARLAAVGERAWMVESGHDRRASVVVVPGKAVRWTVQVPTHGHLRFAVGSIGRLAQQVRFRLQVESADEASTVYETTVEAQRRGSDRRWHDVEVDLTAYARRTVDLVAETFVDGAFDSRLGLPAWASPVVVDAEVEPGGSPSLVLISVDTLRADHLGVYGQARGLSPGIDAWARKRGMVFRHAVAPAPWTLPSHTAMLSGLDTLRHGVNEPYARAPLAIRMVAERLRNAGYATAAITGGGWLHPRYGLAQGFDRYRHPPGEDDLGATVDQALSLIDALPRPFFLFVHTYAVHDYMKGSDATRYATPAEARNELYDDAVLAMDREISRLLDRLDRPDIAGHVGVALTSDHGEELGEEGDFGHGSLRDTVLHVPMIWAFPDGDRAGTGFDRPVRTIDVAPTLLDLAGAATERDTVDPELAARSLAPDRIDHDVKLRLALSFFPLPGHGLSLRQGKRWQYLFDDALLGARSPRGHLVDRVATSGSPPSEDAGEILDRLRTKVRRALRSRQVRATLELRNAGPSHLEGVLRGPALRYARLTDPEATIQVRRQVDDAVEIRLAPGDALRLALIPPADGSVSWSIAGADPRSDIDLQLDQPIAVRWTGTAWEAGPSVTEATMTIRLEPGDAGANADVTTDPELEARLRALGYLGDR